MHTRAGLPLMRPEWSRCARLNNSAIPDRVRMPAKAARMVARSRAAYVACRICLMPLIGMTTQSGRLLSSYPTS